MCPFMWKEKFDNFMRLLEDECAKMLKAHSQAIPEYDMIIWAKTKYNKTNDSI